jgi:hypothetical protein
MRTSTGGGPDLGLGWQEASYAFVSVRELGGGRDGLTDRVEVAVAGRSGETAFHSSITTDRPLPRLAPWHVDRPAAGTARAREACPDLGSALGGRIVVVHGASPSWRLLAAVCPGLRPLAVLDSIGLARALLPGERLGLRALAECLDPRPADLDAEERRQGAARDAALLARVFGRLVTRMLPQATLGHLLDLAAGPGNALPEVGLENGR